MNLLGEIIGERAATYRIIVTEMTKAPRGWNVSGEAKQNIVDEVCRVMRREGARTSNYKLITTIGAAAPSVSRVLSPTILEALLGAASSGAPPLFLRAAPSLA